MQNQTRNGHRQSEAPPGAMTGSKCTDTYGVSVICPALRCVGSRVLKCFVMRDSVAAFWWWICKSLENQKRKILCLEKENDPKFEDVGYNVWNPKLSSCMQRDPTSGFKLYNVAWILQSMYDMQQLIQ